MMIQAVLSNPNHPEYGVATIPFPIPRDQYAHCMELLEALEIGDAVKADCKVEKINSFYTVMTTKPLTKSTSCCGSRSCGSSEIRPQREERQACRFFLVAILLCYMTQIYNMFAYLMLY
jgi:hypothetical protein